MIATDEYQLLRQAAGLLHRAGHTVIGMRGEEVAEFLQGQVTNDVEALEPGDGCYAMLLDHKGKVRADMRILRSDDGYLVLGEAIARRVIVHMIETYSLGRDVRSKDLTDERAVLSVIGPEARRLLDAPEHVCLQGEHGFYVSTDLGVDVVCTAEAADGVREALGLEPVSEEAAECLRVESGRPRLGLDMDGGTIPQEAGLNERAVSFTKGCYIGQETVARLHYKGKPNRSLRGLRLAEPAVHGDPIMLGEKQVGTIGSACVSPALGPIALAVMRREAAPGDGVSVGGAEATVVELPFSA